MPGIDWSLVGVAFTRATIVVTAFATFLCGFSIRYGIRAAGWPRWTVRGATVATWAIGFGLPARALLVPLDSPAERLTYQVLEFASIPILVFFAFGLDGARRAIDRRPSRRVALFAALDTIQETMSTLETPADRDALEGLLGDLDRYVEPDTFEYIQLTRSRIVSWLDGGPRADTREARWSARMIELAPSVRPASWWQADRWSALGQRIRAPILGGAPWLAVVSGLVVGRSAVSGSIVLALPAAILIGYLLTWRWELSAAPFFASAAIGLTATTLLVSASRRPDTLITLGVISSALLAAAAVEWRRARRRPDLHVLPGPGEPEPMRPRAS